MQAQYLLIVSFPIHAVPPRAGARRKSPRIAREIEYDLIFGLAGKKFKFRFPNVGKLKNLKISAHESRAYCLK
jgi:hypothetical protein